jgi:hypothetical protein
LIATTPDGFRLDAIFNLSKRIFGVQHIEMTLENRGITTSDQDRPHIVSYLIVPCYISRSSSLVATIVVGIAKLILYNSGALVEPEQRNSKRVSMLDLQQQG